MTYRLTPKEAIEAIKCNYPPENYSILREALDMAIIDIERQIPKKPKEYEDKYYACPNCGNPVMMKWECYSKVLMDKSNGLPYCLGCGQSLDWGDDE